jgi:hypothetical protein
MGAIVQCNAGLNGLQCFAIVAKAGGSVPCGDGFGKGGAGCGLNVSQFSIHGWSWFDLAFSYIRA